MKTLRHNAFAELDLLFHVSFMGVAAKFCIRSRFWRMTQKDIFFLAHLHSSRMKSYNAPGSFKYHSFRSSSVQTR